MAVRWPWCIKSPAVSWGTCVSALSLSYMLPQSRFRRLAVMRVVCSLLSHCAGPFLMSVKTGMREWEDCTCGATTLEGSIRGPRGSWRLGHCLHPQPALGPAPGTLPRPRPCVSPEAGHSSQFPAFPFFLAVKAAESMVHTHALKEGGQPWKWVLTAVF